MNNKKIIQKNGWSLGENTIARKLTIQVDADVGTILNEKKKQTGITFGRIINYSLRKDFGLVV